MLKPNKPLLVVLLTYLFLNTLLASIKDPAPMSFGDIKPEYFNFNIEDYPDFNPNANAVILCDYGQEFYSQFGNSYQTRTIIHRRILILNENGVNQANVNVLFDSDEKSNANKNKMSSLGKYGPFWINGKGGGVFKVKAASYQLMDDGSVTSTIMDEDAVYVDDLNSQQGDNQLIFAIPKAKAGSIIEYTYTIVKPQMIFSRIWYFQSEIPCLHNEFRMAYPETTSYALIGRGLMRTNLQPIPSNLTTKQFNDFKQKVSKFELDNIPGLTEENFINSMDNYRSGIMIQVSRYWNYNIRKYKNLVSTWQELAKEYILTPNLGKQLNRYSKMFAEIKESLPEATTVEQKVEVCYNFVRDYFIWNGRYSREPSWHLNEVYERKTASSAGINMFLTALLRQYGLNVKMAYASTHHNGWVNKSYPFVLQFNHAICVVEHQEKYIFLDAINKYRPYNIIPANLTDTYAFILDVSQAGLVKIKSNDISRTNTIVNISIDGDTLVSNVTLRFYNYSAIESRALLNSQHAPFLNKYLNNNNIDFSDTEVEVIGQNNDVMPLIVTFNYSEPGAIQIIDSTIIIEPGSLFENLNKNPFLEKTRQLPVEMSYGFKKEYRYSIYFPEGYSLQYLPKNQTKIISDRTAAVDAIYQLSPGKLDVRFVFQSANNIYKPDKYAELRELFLLWEELNNESIVFVLANQ